MIAFDTNVLVRLLVEDYLRQLATARKTLQLAADNEELVFLGDVVLAELEWVLESAYSVPRTRILEAVQRLVSDPRFEFEDRSRIERALGEYQKGKGDLSDYLLGQRAESVQARTTFTFDRALRGETSFTLLNG